MCSQYMYIYLYFLKDHYFMHLHYCYRFELGSHTISAIVNSVTNKYSTEAQLAKVNKSYTAYGIQIMEIVTLIFKIYQTNYALVM